MASRHWWGTSARSVSRPTRPETSRRASVAPWTPSRGLRRPGWRAIGLTPCLVSVSSRASCLPGRERRSDQGSASAAPYPVEKEPDHRDGDDQVGHEPYQQPDQRAEAAANTALEVGTADQLAHDGANDAAEEEAQRAQE